jgi:hypothetical protein
MIPKCSLNGYNAYMQFFGLLFMAFILVVVVMFYLQGRHNEITEKYINRTGNIDTSTLEFKQATDQGNRSTFPEDKYPGANYELIRDPTQTAGVGAVGPSGVSISTAKPPPPRTTDIYKMRDCKVYFTDDIKSCDEQAESSTKTCSYTFNGWKEFDTYTDNNENTLTYPIKKYKPNASNTNELINAHFTSKCFKEFDNAGKGGARRFEYKENRLVKFDSKGENDNTEIDTNIFGGKKYTSIQFMNSGVPQDNLNNVIDSICSVKYNRIQVLNGKTFYKFILSGSGDNRVITSIDKLSLMDDQSGFNRINTVAIHDFAILGSHGLRFDDNNRLQIFINEAAINANMNVFKFTYVANLCINSQIKDYAMYPVNLRITDFLQFGAVARNAAKERVVEGIDTSLITNKGSYKGRNAGGSYIDYKKQILDDLEGRRQTEIASLKNASETRKAGYNATINSINNEMTAKYNEKNNFVVPENTFVNVLNLYNRNGRRIFDYASGYKNNRLNNIVIPQGAEVIFMDNSDICMVFKNNTGNDTRVYQFTVPEGEEYECDILVVGGGGGGGHFGGGGGGGQVLFRKDVKVRGTFTATVGKGGKGVPPGYNRNYDTGEGTINGLFSVADVNGTMIEAKGGGGGATRAGHHTWHGRKGFDGGSGGGGSHSNEPSQQGMGGKSNKNSYSGWESYGNAGGKGKPSWMRCNSNNQGCYYSGEPSHASGGGGGAMSSGGDFSYDTGGGNGGRGIDLSGTFGKNVGDKGFFGGGGGGNTYYNAGRAGYGNGGDGLFGGGGNGGMDWVDVGYNAMDGKANTGGGGGGGRWWWYWWSDFHAKGGDGGSGVVILRIKRKIQIMAITNSFEGYYNEAPVSTIAMPPLRIQSNILTSFVYLQKGFYRFRADLGNMGRANPNIIYAELVIYDESNLSGAQYNCKKVFKYNLYNNRYRPSYLRQYIQIPTNKFYKLAYSYYYINNTTSNRNEDFKLYYRYLATAPESLEGSTPANLIAWYRFDGSIEDINPSTTLPKYHLVETKNRQPNYPDDTFQEKGYVNTNHGAFKTINNIDLAGKSFSISVWMRTKDNGHCYFISQGKQYWDEYRYYTNGYLHIGHRGSGHYVLGFWGNDLEHNSSGGRAYPEDANKWVHMVFVVDVALNRASCGRRMYRNGALIAEDRNRALYNGQGKLYIGQLATWGEQHYNYNMDISDFMVFDKALTGSEAAHLFNNTPNPGEARVDTTTVSLSSANNDTLFSTNAINSINTPMDTFLFNGANVNTGYKSSTVRNVFSTIGYTNKDYVSFQNLATYIDTDSIDYFGIRILTSRRNAEQRLIDGEGARLTNEIAGSTVIANLNTLSKAIKGIDYKGLLPVGNPQLLPSKTFISIFGRGNEANYITIDKVRDLNNLANPGLTDAVYVEALN